MKPELKERLDRFAEYSHIYKAVTKWDSPMTEKLCALQCVCSGLEADTDKYKECRKYIKENAGFLSSIKGGMLPAVAWQMSVEKDPEAFFQSMQDCYKALREEGFSACDYLVIAALYLTRQSSDYSAAAAKMKKLYQAMKQLHPFATGQNDYAAAAMLAASGIKVPEFQQRVCRIEELLQKCIAKGNKLQSISNMILLFDVDDIALCERAITLHRAFRDKGYNFKSHDMTGILALLSISRKKADVLTEEMIEAADYLKEKKGFGSLSMDKCQRALMASGLFITEEIKDGDTSSISSTALQSMVVDYLVALQTMYVCCIVTASQAATTDTSS